MNHGKTYRKWKIEVFWRKNPLRRKNFILSFCHILQKTINLEAIVYQRK